MNLLSAMLFLFLLHLFGCNLLSLQHLLLILLQFPQPILHVLLVLKKLILHFVVIPEEIHLVVDEGFEGMGLEAHIDQEDEVIHQITVWLRWMEVALIQLGFYRSFEGL